MRVPVGKALGHPETPNQDISELGAAATATGAFFLLNTESVFEEGENPGDYRTLRTAYILRSEGEVQEKRTGAPENPERSQTSIEDLSKFIFDEPGANAVNGNPRAIFIGHLVTDQVFSVQEQNKKTGQISAPTLYYRVRLAFTKDGKLISRAEVISRAEFLRLTGQEKHKKKEKKPPPLQPAPQ